MKIYGPYQRKDGRRHVIYYDEETKTRRTQSYPRYLMEQSLGRELLPEEQVDHINEDPTDDVLNNYQILSVAENNRKSVINQGRSAKYIEFLCPVCGSEFSARVSRVRGNQEKQGKSGPYCSKKCAGKSIH